MQKANPFGTMNLNYSERGYARPPLPPASVDGLMLGGGGSPGEPRGHRDSRKTGRSEATTGRPALIASSTARPQPSLVEGKASTSAAAYQPGSSASGTVPSSTTSSPRRRPRSGIEASTRSRYSR